MTKKPLAYFQGHYFKIIRECKSLETTKNIDHEKYQLPEDQTVWVCHECFAVDITPNTHECDNESERQIRLNKIKRGHI